MTWQGESSQSGVAAFVEDGTPEAIIGTPGQVLSWTTLGPQFEDSAGGPHNILSSVHSDTEPGVVQKGDLIFGSGDTAAWARLPIATEDDYVLTSDNGVPVWKEPEDGDFLEQIFASGAPAAAFAVDATGVFTSTVGTSYVQIPDMVIPTPPSGTYVCFFNAASEADKGNRTIQYAVFANDVEIVSSERELNYTSANTLDILSTAGVAVEVNGSEDIDVRWRRIGLTAEFVIRGRTLSIFSVRNNA